MPMYNLDEELKSISESLVKIIYTILPQENDSCYSRLYEAMRYSTVSGGKRLRPFIIVTTAQIFGVSRSSALNVAAALEFIHTYSLIHDDLPDMDDDDFRRGRPSCHKRFDNATAILAGDSLLTLAFEVLADPSTHSNPNVRCELIKVISKAAGARGMVAGQMFDIMSANKNLSINQIINLQRLKTGELFSASCEAGAILGNAPMNLRTSLKGFAYDLGLIFQITDDLLDDKANDNTSTSSTEDTKPTFVKLLGRDKAKDKVQILAEQAIDHLRVFGKKAQMLRILTEYIVDRKI